MWTIFVLLFGHFFTTVQTLLPSCRYNSKILFDNHFSPIGVCVPEFKQHIRRRLGEKCYRSSSYGKESLWKNCISTWPRREKAHYQLAIMLNNTGSDTKLGGVVVTITFESVLLILIVQLIFVIKKPYSWQKLCILFAKQRDIIILTLEERSLCISFSPWH